MRQLFILTVALALTALTSCGNNSSSDRCSDKLNTYFGITIHNSGPRGSAYTDSTGNNFQFRIFRVHVINDTIIPIELTINFPSDSVTLLPKYEKYIRVFLFPEAITPNKQEEVYNFGVTGLESFLDTALNKPTSLKMIIRPKEDHLLYIGELFKPDEFGGLARSQLFINGQNINASFLPITFIKNDIKNRNKLDIVFGVAIDPPDYYSLIPCGQIVFKK